jgi:hypothetical protein
VKALVGIFYGLVRPHINQNPQAPTPQKSMWNKSIEKISVPGLSKRGNSLLLRFINLSDRSLSHPLSWRRFHGFVCYAHAHRARLQAVDLQLVLEKSGFSAFDSQRLSLIYEHGRAILKKSTPVFRDNRFWGDR